MRSIIKGLTFVAAVGLVLNACKKDAKNPVLSASNAKNTLTASTSALTLDSTTKTVTAITFKWDSVNYNIGATTTYILQIDKSTDNFASPTGVNVGTNKYTYSYTVGDLNTAALKFMDSVSGTSTVSVRVLSFIQAGTNFYDSVYSNVVTVAVTPYIVVVPISYTFLYVPGAYQGWAPATAPELAGTDGVNYQGFIRLNSSGGTFEYKFTSENDWAGTNYGDGGSIATAGNITTDALSTVGSAGNLTVPAAGYYFVQANITALSESSTAINSFVANGSATGNTPVTLSYDSVANVWSATNVALSAGTLQYIANPTATDASKLTFGLGTDSYHVALGAASSVNVPAAGNYDIKLVLSVPDNYTDTVKVH